MGNNEVIFEDIKDTVDYHLDAAINYVKEKDPNAIYCIEHIRDMLNILESALAEEQ